MRNEIAQVISQDKVMELIYGNNNRPKEILGRHMVANGQVISAYHPEAVRMSVVDESGREYDMDPVERLSIFALYFPTQRKFSYQIRMTFRDGNTYLCEDPYSYDSMITEQEEESFLQGTWINSYEKLGAHPMTIQGVKGVYFAVWAPNARRVSVVGDFNFWNGMIYPMHRLERSGIFELFIPRIPDKAMYRFEVKAADSRVMQKIDPFGTSNLNLSHDACVIPDPKEFSWTDQQWMRDRNHKNWAQNPFAICDRIFDDPIQEEFLDNGCFTHVLLRTDSIDEKLRLGIRQWVNGLHRKNIGVLLDVYMDSFMGNEIGLKYYDGTPLYDHDDERIHHDKAKNLYRFRHGRKEVVSYLLSNLIFWIREYHIDGFIFNDVSEMIYPSYISEEKDQKNEQSNMEQSYENVLMHKLFTGREGDSIPVLSENRRFLYQKDAEDFLIRAVEEIKKEDSNVLAIADEKAEAYLHNLDLVYSKASFDALINYSVPANLGEYLYDAGRQIRTDHYKLSLPLMKNGMRNTVLNLALQNTVHFGKTFFDDVFLNEYDKLSWRKLTMGYMMGAPGKKRWTWQAMESAAIQNYLKRLFQLYLSRNSLCSREEKKTSFAWINGMDGEHKVLSFIRRSPSGKGNLLFLCNFSRKKQEGYRVGVPKYGSYKLLLNSDWEEFGGAVRTNEVILKSMSQEWDLQPYSLRVTISGMSVLIFEY